MSRPVRQDGPEKRLGVWKCVEQVPPHRRFDNFAPESFPHNDPWTAFIEQKADQLGWDSFDKYGRAGEYWQDFMADNDRHYALADPDHIEAYITELRNGGPRGSRTLRTVYTNYYAPLNGFYKWLMSHVEYRHAYNPCFMAAANGGTVREIWETTY